jgi:hypothetical protein
MKISKQGEKREIGNCNKNKKDKNNKDMNTSKKE